MKLLYKWKAYTFGNTLADAGHAWGENELDAEGIARMCVGGPLADKVSRYVVEPVLSFAPPYAQVTEDEAVN